MPYNHASFELLKGILSQKVINNKCKTFLFLLGKCLHGIQAFKFTHHYELRLLHLFQLEDTRGNALQIFKKRYTGRMSFEYFFNKQYAHEIENRLVKHIIKEENNNQYNQAKLYVNVFNYLGFSSHNSYIIYCIVLIIC